MAQMVSLDELNVPDTVQQIDFELIINENMENMLKNCRSLAALRWDERTQLKISMDNFWAIIITNFIFVQCGFYSILYTLEMCIL